MKIEIKQMSVKKVVLVGFTPQQIREIENTIPKDIKVHVATKGCLELKETLSEEKYTNQNGVLILIGCHDRFLSQIYEKMANWCQRNPNSLMVYCSEEQRPKILKISYPLRPENLKFSSKKLELISYLRGKIKPTKILMSA